MEKKEKSEDATKYGEFVCSNYHWISLDEQKRRTKKLDNMTKKENNEENK